MTAHVLAGRCFGFARDALEALIERHLPRLRIPRTFGGHQVGADVRADLAFTAGLLLEAGVPDLAGAPIRDALAAILEPVDGPRTNTFFSYRVAETAIRLGWAGADLAPNIAEACDSTAAVPALRSRRLPRNYAAVLARCEVARAGLGLIPGDDAVLADLMAQTVEMLDSEVPGLLDDSRTAAGRYDIYSADVHLFTEPFLDRLEPVWTRGARGALALGEKVGATNGATFTWGRSTGALSICLTLELAGLAHRHDLGADRAMWVERGSDALDRLRDWFDHGLITAHQHRSTYGYRGPFRRLQMSLDCLGKVVSSALALRDGPDTGACGHAAAYPHIDRFVPFARSSTAGAWVHRSEGIAFVLPLVGATTSDYLPAPVNPGLFEVPVDSGLPVAMPFVVSDGRRFAPAGPPSAVVGGPFGISTRHDLIETGHLEVHDEVRRFPGTREASTRVERRSLVVHERLRFTAGLPEAVALQVCETSRRPLRVDFDLQDEHGAVTAIPTAGMKEWRSFWAELPVVHQVDLEPRRDMSFRWSVTPKLRVLTTAHDHHYHRSLYDPLAADVVDARFPMGRLNDDRALDGTLDGCDIFHLHWPEWFLGNDLDRNRAFVDRLRRRGVRIVWTQHNLVPHNRDPQLTEVYRLWAAAADGVLHHSEWGRAAVTARYRFRPEAVHALVPHPHFGHLSAGRDAAARRSLERRLGLRHDVIRLGIVGAPRPEKDVAMAMDALTRSSRSDVELVVFGLADEEPPADRRIHAEPYVMVPRAVYEERLGLIDVLVLPFRRGQMLTTGTVGDAVAHGIPALASDWEFLSEVLGDAAIVYGSTSDDLTKAIDGLDGALLERAAAATAELRERYSAAAVAARLLEALEAVGTSRL